MPKASVVTLSMPLRRYVKPRAPRSQLVHAVLGQSLHQEEANGADRAGEQRMLAAVVTERQRNGIKIGTCALEGILACANRACRMGKVPDEVEVFAREGACQKRGTQSKPRG